jgi:3-hydroxy-9,10-secoandrosta-1,3,5(10)-triene-9,17-dione monooxygenase reductase component
MSIDSRAFRQTVGQFATGVTVVAVGAEDELRAITANSFTSLSLDPPLVLFCLGKDTKAGQSIQMAKGFSINILQQNQQHLSAYFAGAWKAEAPPAFTFITWAGGPRLEGCAAALGCEVHGIHEGGDHWIVVGRVVALYVAEDPVTPLLFYRGRYVSLEQGQLAGGSGS